MRRTRKNRPISPLNRIAEIDRELPLLADEKTSLVDMKGDEGEIQRFSEKIQFLVAERFSLQVAAYNMKRRR